MFDRTFHALVALVAGGVILGLPSAPAAAQSSALEGLSVHGFLTQAYGRTDGPQYNGLTDHGTADYRVAALQFRYDATDRHAFVIQLSHERFGQSVLTSREPEVDLDWAFYEHRFGDNTLARVGKVRMPTGIYNEIRDVGTLLPLYRPPDALYGELIYTNETVDGLMVGHRVPLGDWTVELDGFLGSWDFLQFDFETRAKVEGGGLQVWLHTPLEGLRVGGAGIHYTARDLAGLDPHAEDGQTIWLAALDGTFPRLFVRGELLHLSYGEDSFGYGGSGLAYYGQVGVPVGASVSLIAQAERSLLDLDVFDFPAASLDGEMSRDLSLGLQFRASPHLVLKLEGHHYRGFVVNDEMRMAPGVPPTTLTYGLFSVSTSF